MLHLVNTAFRLYGMSPVITLFNNIMTLIAGNYVNHHILRVNAERIIVQTRNMDSMRLWRSVKEKMTPILFQLWN